MTYITETHNLTENFPSLKSEIDKCRGCGGGDLPESVCCAFYDCVEKLDWREDAVKITVLITDAPPHGIFQFDDSFPDGCPLNNDPVCLAHKMAEKGIALYCAGCEPRSTPYREFYAALCLTTGGKYIPLADAEQLVELLIGGAREELAMEALMQKLNDDILKEAAKNDTRVNEDELARKIQELIEKKSNLIVQSLLFYTLKIINFIF